MKPYFIAKLQKLLFFLAQKTIKKYQPGIVAITGSVGKTSTKLAIASVLSGVRKIRVSGGNFNNEIGVPLTILGNYGEIKGLLFWPKVIVVSFLKLVFRFKYPEILVLEYAIQRPGDMKYLLEIAKPQIGIFTAMGDVPVHVEFFSGPDAVLKEKSRLIESLPTNGFAILNADDEMVYSVKSDAKAHVLSFGFSDKAEVRITNFENRYIGSRPNGVFFKINYGGTFVPVRIEGITSRAQAYSCAAASALGLVFGLNLVRITENLQKFTAAHHRMELVAGLKESYILDDSYNAAPLSMINALHTLRDMKAKRRVAILGDMLEVGKYSLEAHEALGVEAAKIVDILITVGLRAKFIAETARAAKFLPKNIFIFEAVEDALEPVVDLIKKGDLILVKGSHSIGLEKIVERLKESN